MQIQGPMNLGTPSPQKWRVSFGSFMERGEIPKSKSKTGTKLQISPITSMSAFCMNAFKTTCFLEIPLEGSILRILPSSYFVLYFYSRESEGKVFSFHWAKIKHTKGNMLIEASSKLKSSFISYFRFSLKKVKDLVTIRKIFFYLHPWILINTHFQKTKFI